MERRKLIQTWGKKWFQRNVTDALVIGAGHNGLTAAAYLAKAGLSVLVTERRELVGGCCVTEESAPECRASTCSYIASMLLPRVVQDLDLGGTWIADDCLRPLVPAVICERASLELVAGWRVYRCGNSFATGSLGAFIVRHFERDETKTFFLANNVYGKQGSWDDQREILGDLVLKQVARYAPNVRDAVIARQVLTPFDLERTYGLTEGNIFHADLCLEQLFFMRPVPGWAQYRTPIRGLYLCGAGAHPGGGVTGAPGHNAAQQVLLDLRKNARFAS